MDRVLRLTELSVAYHLRRSRVSVLQGVNLVLHKGEALGIYGESGGGKTTLTRTILRLLPPSTEVDGAIDFRGEDLLSLATDGMRRLRGAAISLIPQEPSIALNPVVRIETQVAEILRTHQALNWKTARSEARSHLKQIFGRGSDRIAHSYPHQLSGGERQRVVIIQAICCNPVLLIADEPTSALDSQTQFEILNLLRQLRSRTAMGLLFFSHNRAALNFVSDRCVELRNGRLLQ